MIKVTVPPRRRPQIDNIAFVLMTSTQNYSFPIKDTELILKNSEFNSNWNTVLLITGWSTSFSTYNGALYALHYAYMCRGNTNFIVSKLYF